MSPLRRTLRDRPPGPRSEAPYSCQTSWIPTADARKKIRPETTENGLAECRDASDDILRNPKYLAPLRTVPINNLTSSVTGTITISAKYALEKVRVFHKNNDKWTYMDSSHEFRGGALGTGLELGIDARDVRRPNEWDGRVPFTPT
ncbi:hypothetical protein J3459_011396 [Metarhizium acridum]|uniref:uncharacterized protein n=1 Tax=Metarhizium acridum TaxID=92637 RepID=UPI001C6CC8CD|nr:hypothetical protein J3459_021621 [Metarhizium acridum]KAG8405846.1 hypothetical protein J3458_021777 [Metarhizium acridum]KAG8420084.1 hypothetical protein J3459_011396 [Metarhizium acridum]